MSIYHIRRRIPWLILCRLAWINVNFTVTPDTLPLLFRLLSDPALQIRLETANAFLRMILKGLKVPLDKLQLIRVLSLGEVLTRLEEKTRGDEDEVSFREGLGKLANGLGLEISKLVDEVGYNQHYTGRQSPYTIFNADDFVPRSSRKRSRAVAATSSSCPPLPWR